MKVTYDPDVDVLRILFSNTQIEESEETRPGVILDYDKEGNVVGMEILDAFKADGESQICRIRRRQLILRSPVSQLYNRHAGTVALEREID